MYCLHFSVLIQFIESGDIYSWKGYTIAAAMFGINVFKTLIQQRYLYYAFTSGMHLRTVTTAMIYRKVNAFTSGMY